MKDSGEINIKRNQPIFERKVYVLKRTQYNSIVRSKMIQKSHNKLYR